MLSIALSLPFFAFALLGGIALLLLLLKLLGASNESLLRGGFVLVASPVLGAIGGYIVVLLYTAR